MGSGLACTMFAGNVEKVSGLAWLMFFWLGMVGDFEVHLDNDLWHLVRILQRHLVGNGRTSGAEVGSIKL